MCVVRVHVVGRDPAELIEYSRSSMPTSRQTVTARASGDRSDELLLEVVYDSRTPGRCERSRESEGEIVRLVQAWRNDFTDPPVVVAYPGIHRPVQLSRRMVRSR